MRLLEYESKRIFEENGIPIPPSFDLTTIEQLKSQWGSISEEVIVKSQIAIGGRGKAGLIKIADNYDQAQELSKEFMGKEIGGHKVEAILIEERANILKEIYASVAIDASRRQFLYILCKEGGVDIEQLAHTNPDAISKYYIDTEEGVSDSLLDEMARSIVDEEELLSETKDILSKLWSLTKKLDAQLVEINPLGIVEINKEKKVIALDAKMILDDNASYRQPKIKELSDKKMTDREKEASEAGFAFVPLEGNIGIMANGAGLTLALLDTLTDQGLKPANFLDVGGGASSERVYKAISLLFSMKPKSILINIFGGITRCDDVAKGIIEALKKFNEQGKDIPPFYIRLSGTKQKEGVQILQKENIKAFNTIKEAIDAMKADWTN